MLPCQFFMLNICFFAKVELDTGYDELNIYFVEVVREWWLCMDKRPTWFVITVNLNLCFCRSGFNKRETTVEECISYFCFLG